MRDLLIFRRDDWCCDISIGVIAIVDCIGGEQLLGHKLLELDGYLRFLSLI